MVFPKKIMSDTGGNFISDNIKNLNIEQAVSSSHHCKINAQAETCIKFIKCTIKYIDTKSDIHIALFQISLTLLGLRLSSPAMLLFYHLIRGISQ